jgi:hypothetical protein
MASSEVRRVKTESSEEGEGRRGEDRIRLI